MSHLDYLKKKKKNFCDSDNDDIKLQPTTGYTT